MSKRFLFAGASSTIALEAAAQLKQEGHTITGISTKTGVDGYDEFHTISAYEAGRFPLIEGYIDGLVYFPGTINLKPFARLTANDFMHDYLINSMGAVAFAQTYLANLKTSETASIVFISSVAVAVGMPFHASISMAKGAIEGLTKALAAELAPGIRVNCVAPSLTQTPLGEKFINTPEKFDASQKRNPLKKIGSVTDVANAITFLLSDKAGWITGQVIGVDGGMNNIRV